MHVALLLLSRRSNAVRDPCHDTTMLQGCTWSGSGRRGAQPTYSSCCRMMLLERRTSRVGPRVSGVDARWERMARQRSWCCGCVWGSMPWMAPSSSTVRQLYTLFGASRLLASPATQAELAAVRHAKTWCQQCHTNAGCGHLLLAWWDRAKRLHGQRQATLALGGQPPDGQTCKSDQGQIGMPPW